MTQTQTTIDIGAAVLKDVERHKSFTPDGLVSSVMADVAACFESEAHVTTYPLPDAYHALLEAVFDLKQALLENQHPRARLVYWSTLGLVFDVKAMMASQESDG